MTQALSIFGPRKIKHLIESWSKNEKQLFLKSLSNFSKYIKFFWYTFLFKIKFPIPSPTFKDYQNSRRAFLKEIRPINRSLVPYFTWNLDRRGKVEVQRSTSFPQRKGRWEKRRGVREEATENAFIGLCIATRSHYKRAAPVKAIIGCKAA